MLQGSALAALSSFGITPLRIELCGRALGIGQAFTAVRDDVNAIFYNPGSLPWAKGIGVTLSSFSNISASQIYPTGFGSSMGLAVVAHNVSDFPTTSGSAAAVSSNTLIVSYGTKLSALPYFGDSEFTQRLGLGISIKTLFGQSFRQTGALDLSGNGIDMDMGILYKYSSWIALGASLNNFIPAGTLGMGTLFWSDRTQEGFPAYIKIGIAAKPIGDIRSPYRWEDYDLQLSADYEYLNSLKSGLFHLGAELLFERQYFLRAGLEQYPHLAQTNTGFTLGFGMLFSDWNFDLAYATEPLKEQGTLYFSARYFPEGWKFVTRPILEISLHDGIVTYDKRITISGEVDPAVEELYVDSKKVELDGNHRFITSAPLVVGENIIKIETRYEGEKTTRIYSVIRKVVPRKAVKHSSISDGQTVYTNMLEVSGRTEPFAELYINDQRVEVDEDGNYTAYVPLKMGENRIRIERKYNGHSVVDEFLVARERPPEDIEKELKAKAKVKKIAATKKRIKAVRSARALKKKRILERKKAKIRAARLKKIRKQQQRTKKEIAALKTMVKARKEDIKEARKKEQVRREHKNFLKLQELVRKKVDLVIIAKAKIKIPAGYLAVYIIRGMDKYIAFRHIGSGLVNLDLYDARTSAWTTLNTVAYNDIRDLI